MRDGEQKLRDLPNDVKQQIIKKYSSLEEFYFRVFYNRHQHYIAFKGKNDDLVNQLDEEIYEIQDELEEFGAYDGHEITTAISTDFSENVAKAFTTKVLGEVGASEDDIRKFIEAYLNKSTDDDNRN